MQTLWQDVRFSLRVLARHRGFTATSIAVLALGIGVNAGIFTLINSLLLRPRVGSHAPGTIVGVHSVERSTTGSSRAFSYPNYLDLREAKGPFTTLAAHNLAMAGVSEGNTTRRVMVDIVSANYFEALGAHLALGRSFTLEEERPGAPAFVAIASYSQWARTGFAADILGRTTMLNGRSYTIVGVTPHGFGGTTVVIEPDFYVPLSAHDLIEWDLIAGAAKTLARRDYHRLLLIGRLPPGETIEAADRDVAAIAQRMEQAFPAENARQELLVRPLSRINISTSPSDDHQLYGPVSLLQGLAGVVLLISCLNLANMTLAHGVSRSREMAIRQAIGGGRARLVRQLLTEGFILAAAGAVVGLVAAYLGSALLMASVTRILPMTLALEPSVDGRVVAATVAFAALATIMFGLWPAVRLSRTTDTIRALNDQTAGMGGARRWFSTANLLITAQMALSLALLIVSALFVRAAAFGAQTNPGFAVDRTVHAEIDPALAGMNESRGREVRRLLLERLRGLPGVEAASAASIVPFGDVSITRRVQADGPRLRGDEPGATGKLVGAQYYVVGADYFRALGIAIVAGREFTSADELRASGVMPVVIDTPLAERLFPNESPVGRRLQFAANDDGDGSDRPMTIVGVAARTRHDFFERNPEPHIYLPSGQIYLSSAHLHIRAAQGTSPSSLVDAVRAEIRAAAPALPVFSVDTLEAFRDRSIWLWVLRAAARIFLVLGASAAFLAVVGLYGVKSYIVSRRTREFGVRQALGATPRAIVTQVLREGLPLTLGGLALGLGLGALLGRLLSVVLYQVSPFDPVSFAAATGMLFGASLIAAGVPARRASRIEPMRAIRSE